MIPTIKITAIMPSAIKLAFAFSLILFAFTVFEVLILFVF